MSEKFGVECPISCGRCCKDWRRVIDDRGPVTEYMNDGRESCPYMAESGCTLARDKRPTLCTSYLCEWAKRELQVQGKMPESPRVLIAIPPYRVVSAVAYANIIGTILENSGAGLIQSVCIRANSYITQARNEFVKLALKGYKEGVVTHLWMIDDDVIVPPGSLMRLLARDVPVIGGTYFTRDFRVVAYDLEPFRLLTELPANGMIRVGGLGAGCTLIRCDVLLAMQEKYGDGWWFATSLKNEDTSRQDFLGEDVFFFKRLAEMEIPTYLDVDVQCGHFSETIIDLKTFKAFNFIRSNPEFAPELRTGKDAVPVPAKAD